MLIEAVCSFVEKELLPHRDDIDRADAVSPELTAQIHGKTLAAGFYAFNMPKEANGGGLDHLPQALVKCELSKVSWALHVSVARPSKILTVCTGEQLGDYLLPCVRGEKTDCFTSTKPDTGSDANPIKARAARGGDAFVINGSKHFISRVGHAGFAIVFAVADSYEHNNRKCNVVTALLVDKGTPGTTVRCGPKCVSSRSHHTYEIFFDDCRASASKVFGEVDRGWEVANAWLTAGRVMVTADCIGQARRALDLSLCWAADRKQLGQLIDSYQGISFKLADMTTQICAAELITLHTVWEMDQSTMIDGEAGMAELFVSETLGRVADEVVQIFGGMGLMDEGPVERIWCNARVVRIWEGTSGTQRHIVPRELPRPLLR